MTTWPHSCTSPRRSLWLNCGRMVSCFLLECLPDSLTHETLIGLFLWFYPPTLWRKRLLFSIISFTYCLSCKKSLSCISVAWCKYLTWWGELLIQLQRVKLWAGRCVWIKMHPARHFAILLIPQQIHLHCNCNQGCFTLITDQNSEEIWNNAKIQSGMRHILYVLFQHWLYFQLK